LGVGGSTRLARDDIGKANHHLGTGGLVGEFGGLKHHRGGTARERADEGEAGEEVSCAHLFQATVEP
jgi:hypothetical protein